MISGDSFESALMVIHEISRKLDWLSRSSRIGLVTLLLAPSSVLAGFDVCQPPDDVSRLSLGYSKQDRTRLEGSTSDVRREDRDINLQYRLDDTWLVGVRHRYVILDVAPIELQTNGHLHTLFFPVHRQGKPDGNGFRFSIAPGVSASSNVMKDPGDYTGDTFQLLAALVWTRDLSSRTNLRFGLCGDHSFGKYTVYPSFGFDWRPRPDVTIALGLPVSELTYRARKGIDLSVRLSPDGNEWHVKSRDKRQQSRIVSRAILLELALKWQALERLGVTASVARRFHNRYEVALVDERRVKLSHDAATRVGIALDWLF